ncbi:MAG: ADP-ribosylglycohydrolase family protein [Planctomycetota bacterium]
MTLLDRYRGCLLGLAVGDAVGTTLEFLAPGRFKPIEDMVGGGPFQLEPGQWTDDTSMALCLAESLCERRAFQPVDQLERYVRWFRDGHWSSTGKCFDIGNTTRAALNQFERTGAPFCGSASASSAGNGSLMRLAPVPMAFRADAPSAIHWSGESSRTTHGARAAVDACRYFASLLLGAFAGASKEELLSSRYAVATGIWDEKPLVGEVDEVACGSFKVKDPPAIRGTGYVVESLEAALWAFDRSANFREGCLLAANLGNDADTTAAIYGQIAGAYYASPGIPQEWLARLYARDQIEDFAARLYHLSEDHP